MIIVETVVFHAETGQFLGGRTPFPIDKELEARAVGSLISYARRYGLFSFLGIIVGNEDDDAENASRRRSSSQGAWDRDQRGKERAAKEIWDCLTTEDLGTWWRENREGIESLLPDTVTAIKEMVKLRNAELTGGSAAPAANQTSKPEPVSAGGVKPQAPRLVPKPEPTPAPAQEPAPDDFDGMFQ